MDGLLWINCVTGAIGSRSYREGRAVATDAAYKTPAITKYLFGNEMTPALPYTHAPARKRDSSKGMTTCMMNTMTVIFARPGKCWQIQRPIRKATLNINHLNRFVPPVRFWRNVPTVRTIQK